MDKLIDELTFYSKIDTNKIPYTFSKINVASYFRAVSYTHLDVYKRQVFSAVYCGKDSHDAPICD